jgi:prepilin-type processing-associated H-X9-DG protein
VKGATYSLNATNNKLMTMRFDVYTCPSDMPVTSNYSTTPMVQHNYAANYGNTVYGQHDNQNVMFQGAPFGNTDNSGLGGIQDSVNTRPYLGQVPYKNITDGLSNTLVASEIIQGHHNDVRGRIIGFTDGGAFTGWYTPNSPQPDAMASGLCISYDPNPPCVPQGASVGNATTPPVNTRFLTSRSRHPGGVHAALADGSTSFFNDMIDLQTWRALTSTQGAEVISN